MLSLQIGTNQTAGNSYDPNHKTCQEGERLNPDIIDEYAHYLIRFENTGTVNVIYVNVVVTIDGSLFELNSLEITSSSHECMATLENNLVAFGFDHIILSFQGKFNDGYVAFKIKTKDNLSVGDVMTKRADMCYKCS